MIGLCGADPLVRAGPPGPAIHRRHDQADEGGPPHQGRLCL